MKSVLPDSLHIFNAISGTPTSATIQGIPSSSSVVWCCPGFSLTSAPSYYSPTRHASEAILSHLNWILLPFFQLKGKLTKAQTGLTLLSGPWPRHWTFDLLLYSRYGYCAGFGHFHFPVRLLRCGPETWGERAGEIIGHRPWWDKPVIFFSFTCFYLKRLGSCFFSMETFLLGPLLCMSLQYTCTLSTTYLCLFW